MTSPMLNVRAERRAALDADARFSILIPSWNNLPYLQLCVESLRKNSRFRNQIIVHLNQGADGSADWVRQQADLDWSHSDENIGVCYALNACRKLVATDYIVYMNDDMYVCPDWDAALWREIERIGHARFFLLATAIEWHPQSTCSIGRDYGRDVANFDEARLLRDYASLPFADWQGATWPPNVVHRDLWDLVGGYSTEFSPGMYSDPDFSMKLWQAGVRLFKGIAEARVYHFGSKSVARIVKNPGYYSFIGKWGMTSSTVTKLLLRRGDPFDGPLTEQRASLLLRLKNTLRRIETALRRNRY